MSDEAFLFICDVLPTTRVRALALLSIVSLALAAAVLLAASALTFVATWLGVAGAVVLTLAMLFWTLGNPLLAFYREYQQVSGIISPADSVRSARWPWFALAAMIIMAISPAPVWAAVLMYAALITFIYSRLGAFQRRLSGVIREFCEVVFIHLAYPDTRFCGPAGNGGLWLPSLSMTRRMVRLAAHLAPVYVVLAASTYRWLGFRFPREADLGTAWVVATGLLLLAPHVLLFAAQLAPLAAYLPVRCTTASSGNDWERAVNHLANSKWVDGNLTLAEHFFIGWHVPLQHAAPHPFKVIGNYDLPCRTPALLHRSIIRGNVHLLGSTQSGKTSIGLLTLLIQLVRGWMVRTRDRVGRPLLDGHGCQVWARSELAPMLIIDMKGDLCLFNTVREECRARGQTFKFFTLAKGQATSYFNPLLNLGIHDRVIAEFCELVLNALSLFHGLSYGRSYYSKQSRDLFLKALKGAARKPESWEELYDLLLNEIDPKKHKDVFELVSSIFALAQYPVLGPAPPGVDVIHMPTVISERQVVLFSLPARLSAISARDVAKLALFAFTTAAADWNDRFEERISVACLDEGQIICSSNIATLFQQASGAKMCIFLINQGRSDLDVPDAPNLSETVRVNTRFKQMFTIGDPKDAQDLIRMSGERIGILRTYMNGRDGRGCMTSSVTEKETLSPVLTQNEINAVSNDPNGSLIHVTMDAGLTTLGGVPRHIQTPFPMSADEYQRRLHTPWPTAPETTTVQGAAARTVINTKEPEEVQQQAEQDYAQLLDFFRQTARRAGRDRMRDWVDPHD